MIRRFVIAIAASVLSTAVAVAQPSSVPWVPTDMAEQRRSLNDDEITICLNKTSALVELDRQVAQAVGDTLLLNVKFVELSSHFPPYKYDFRLPFAERDLYVEVTNKCQALMGMRLSTGGIPAWLTVSAPYYRSRSVFAVADAAQADFAALEAGQAIGSRLGAPGDTQFTAYLRSMDANTRPQRVPYPNNEVLLDKVKTGSVSAAFLWEPALFLAADGNPENLGITSTFEAPFASPVVEFGIAFPVQDTFLRGLVDEALSVLIADGEIDAIISGFPIPPSLAP